MREEGCLCRRELVAMIVMLQLEGVALGDIHNARDGYCLSGFVALGGYPTSD
jgi:hypothetical protein